MPPLVVMARVRPMSQREQEEGDAIPVFSPDGTTVSALDTNGAVKTRFPLDDLFWMERESQESVYKRSGALAMEAVLRGLNACVFAYGQTGSGKTYSMMGSESDPGIVPRSVSDVFDQIESDTVGANKYDIEVSFYEVYNENVRDLLTDSNADQPPKIRKHPTRGVFIEGLHCKPITSAPQAMSFLKKGMGERITTGTSMNARSSRSHAVFTIYVTKTDGLKGVRRTAAANLVDLAGSERVKRTEVSGTQLTEAKNINQSLLALRRVLDSLASNAEAKKKGQKGGVIPYRDSVLTHVLSDSIGGNSYTLMMALLSPHISNQEDSLSTLRYAARAKQIIMNPKVNEQQDTVALQKSMQAEIENLRQQLSLANSQNASSDFADIEAEITMREMEVDKIKVTQGELDSIVAEFKEREEKLQREMADMEQQKNEMQVVLTTQRQERFAEAFRNAFRMRHQKNVERSSSADNERMAQIQESLDAVHAQVASKDDEIAELRASNVALQNAVQQLIQRLGREERSTDDTVPRLTPSKPSHFARPRSVAPFGTSDSASHHHHHHHHYDPGADDAPHDVPGDDDAHIDEDDGAAVAAADNDRAANIPPQPVFDDDDPQQQPAEAELHDENDALRRQVDDLQQLNADLMQELWLCQRSISGAQPQQQHPGESRSNSVRSELSATARPAWGGQPESAGRPPRTMVPPIALRQMLAGRGGSVAGGDPGSSSSAKKQQGARRSVSVPMDHSDTLKQL